MIDAWMGDCLLLLLIPTFLVSVTLRMQPRLRPGEGFQLVELQTLQAEYRKRYPFRQLILRVIPAILTVYFGSRIILWVPGIGAEGPDLATLLSAVAAVYILSLILTTVLRIRQEQIFVRDHPAFCDSFMPVRPRVLAMLPLPVSLCVLVAAVTIDETWQKLALVGMGLLGMVIAAKLRSRQITHSRFELLWDEPLGNRIAEVVEAFGLKPKKLVLLPSLIANAGAMPDGSVVVTSALRTLATPDEVAAVVAHELSHVRDGEGRKVRLLRLIAGGPIGAIAGFGIAAGQGTPYEALVPSLVGFGAVTL